MISKDSIEAAYSFFHQKWRIYAASQIDSQKDDIEYAIAGYVNSMSPDLYQRLSDGKPDFLLDHLHFADDMRCAVERLEKML